MKKITLILNIILVTIIICISVSALDQERAAIKECEYSFNDGSFGTWDEDTQTGTFMKVTNNNPTIGIGQNGDYEYISYQQPREYYNSFEKPGLISKIPILNVRSGQENKVYINCSFIIGDVRIFLFDYLITSSNKKHT